MRHHTASSSSRSLTSSLFSLSTLSSLLLLLPSPSAAFDCSEIHVGGVDFNFKKLGGPRLIHWEEQPDYENQVQYNYTFEVDLCNKLPTNKGAEKANKCKSGTRVCAIRQENYLTGDRNATIQPIEIAGTYKAGGNGRAIDAKFELLRNSGSNSDADREGVRAELHGGGRGDLDQQAVIEFVCDKELTGDDTEKEEGGEGDDDDDDKGDDKKEKDGKDGKDGKDDKDENGKRVLRTRQESKCEDNGKSLRFCGYNIEDGQKNKKVKTLRLEWRTKYACEDAPSESGSHWGFFTWFIIILFLATAAYLIFGSWLNYNRYGARGWDLLPHGDTIRDIPYIMKDFGRRVKDTMQGPGSRGGYSAV